MKQKMYMYEHLTKRCLIASLVFILFISENVTALNVDHRAHKERLNFLESVEACLKYGENWELLKTYENDNYVAKIIRESGLDAVWLGMRKYIYLDWRWISGQNHTFQQKVNVSGNCAVITSAAIQPTPCATENTNYLCEFQRRRHCLSGHMCFGINDTFVAVGCQSGSWFKAREFCQRNGGDLIVLDSEYKMRRVLENIALLSCRGSNKEFYIGLHREEWTYVNDWMSREIVQGRILSTECAVVTLDQRGRLTRHLRHCMQKAPFICLQHDLRGQTTIATKKSTGFNRKTDALSVVPVVLGSVAGVLMVILVPALMYFIHYKIRITRDNRAKESMEVEMTGLMPNEQLKDKRAQESMEVEMKGLMPNEQLKDKRYKPELSNERYDLLNKNLEHLVEQTQLEEANLLTHLLENEIINNDNRAFIEGIESSHDKKREIFRILQRRSDAAYEKFCDILLNTGQEGALQFMITPVGIKLIMLEAEIRHKILQRPSI